MMLACLAALLAIALLLGWGMGRGRGTLLKRAAGPNTCDFLLVDRGSLIVVRQGVTADATRAGVTGDATTFGQFAITSEGTGGLAFLSDVLQVTRTRQLQLLTDPLPRNGRHGFFWLNGSFPQDPPGKNEIELTFRAAGAPMWALAVPLLLPLPILLLRAARRSRRRRRGMCIRCGYDLRASPERCPECGAAGHSSLPA